MVVVIKRLSTLWRRGSSDLSRLGDFCFVFSSYICFTVVLSHRNVREWCPEFLIMVQS